MSALVGSQLEIYQAVVLVELFARAALDNKGLGDRQALEAIHDMVKPLVENPIGYDQIKLVK